MTCKITKSTVYMLYVNLKTGDKRRLKNDEQTHNYTLVEGPLLHLVHTQTRIPQLPW